MLSAGGKMSSLLLRLSCLVLLGSYFSFVYLLVYLGPLQIRLVMVDLVTVCLKRKEWDQAVWRERERERESERERGRKKESERESERARGRKKERK